MIKPYYTLLIFCSLTLFIFPAGALQKETVLQKLEADFDMKERMGFSDNLNSNKNVTNKVYYRKLYKQYQITIKDNDWKSIPNDEINRWFDILYSINFYASLEDISIDLIHIFNILNEKVEVGTQLQEKAQHLEADLIKNRMFKQLSKIKTNYPDFAYRDIPKIEYKKIGSDKQTILMPNSDGTGLKQIAFDMDSGNKVLVISHPLCKFTEAARSAILNNDRVREVFEKNSFWLISQQPRFYFDSIIEAPYQKIMPFYYVWDEDQWHDVKFDRFPNFFFFKDGRLIKNINGWPKEGRMAELKEALQEIELLTSK